MKTLYRNYSRLVIILIAAVLLMIGFAFTTQSSYAEDDHFTITINTLKGNPYAEKHGSEFQKYTGTEFTSKYGNDIWYYDCGHGKLFINVDPDNYNGGGFHYWVTESDPDSVYNCYTSLVNITTGNHIGSLQEGFNGGYEFFYTGGASANIDFEV